MALTVDEFREHVETELGDDAVQRLLDAAYEAIDEAIGSAGTVSEYLHAGHGDLLLLSRRALSITSISERDVALASGDYELRASGMTLRRKSTGTHPRTHWHGRVDVTYVAYPDEDERDRVAIALVKLDLTHSPGLAAQSLGAWSESYQTSGPSYSQERATILASLGGSSLMAI
jgi:hypothetical protein